LHPFARKIATAAALPRKANETDGIDNQDRPAISQVRGATDTGDLDERVN
jgi:hypothetical protein